MNETFERKCPDKECAYFTVDKEYMFCPYCGRKLTITKQGEQYLNMPKIEVLQ